MYSTTMLPRFEFLQAITTATLWDGQTLVLLGKIITEPTTPESKLPRLGALPLLGPLILKEAEPSGKKTKNLLIFITPTIVDPAGNRVHSLKDMPFATDTIPPQSTDPSTPASTPAR